LSRQRCFGRRGPRGPRMTTASSTSLIMALSGTFAPLMSAAIGTPRPSVRMWRFTPLFARSVGFGPVRSPLLAPSPRRCQASSTSTRSLDDHRSTSAVPDGLQRTRRAAPTSENADGTSILNRSRSAAPSIGSPSSGDTGSRPSRHGLQQEAGRLAVSLALQESVVRSVAKDRRVRSQTSLPRTRVDHTRSVCSRGFRIGS
jgi:hypothetical protein